MPACHPSLLIEEVLLKIFSNLPQSTLYSAALTCQAWKDPALDILWKEVNLINLTNAISPVTLDDSGLVRKPSLSGSGDY